VAVGRQRIELVRQTANQVDIEEVVGRPLNLDDGDMSLMRDRQIRVFLSLHDAPPVVFSYDTHKMKKNTYILFRGEMKNGMNLLREMAGLLTVAGTWRAWTPRVMSISPPPPRT